MDKQNKYHSRNQKSQDFHSINKIDRILIDIQKQLRDSYFPVVLEDLTAFERKRIHSFFDDKPEFQTKTYRDEDKFILKVFPIGNLKKMAEEKAKQVLESGVPIQLDNLGNYERFIVHDHLQSFEGIETISSGEGSNRKLEIKQKAFGRTLKKMIKKIKIF